MSGEPVIRARPKRLLAVDWDYFFPMPTGLDPTWPLYDWGHAESIMYIELLWASRASAFIRNGLDLPGVDGSWRSFWDRFRVTRRATLYTSESNSRAASVAVADGIDEVWLYDAHHDAGYMGDRSLAEGPAEGRFTCENWMMHYALKALARGDLPGVDDPVLHVRYPTHRRFAFEEEPEPAVPVDRAFDDGEPNPLMFDRVFVCRSGAWVPPWCDEDFDRFVAAAPAARHVEIDRYDRSFDEGEARAVADELQALVDRAGEETRAG